MVSVAACRSLKRNPQYLSEAQMLALRTSIRRDGFVAPILVRPMRGKTVKYEIVSGNHRWLAAKAEGLEQVPAVIARLSDAEAARLAINLNTVHGDPNAELLAPFLAELQDDVLAEIHIGADLLRDLLVFDDVLAQRLRQMELPEIVDMDSSTSRLPRNCRCPTCGYTHARAPESSSPSSASPGRNKDTSRS